MDLERKVYKTQLHGEEISLEISRLAGQANAAVIGRYGETAVLAAVVMGRQDSQLPYFPLTVDYEERFYAAGKIIGSRFIRREGRPSDEATLSARLIDRTIRPLFDERLRRDIQVTVMVLAYDEAHDPDTIALLATSAALSISDIPWNGPAAGVDMKSLTQNGKLEYRAFFAGTEERINMIELEGAETAEVAVLGLFERAREEIGPLIAWQRKIVREIGKPKVSINIPEPDPRISDAVAAFIKPKLEEAARHKQTDELKRALLEHLTASGEGGEVLRDADTLFEEAVNAFVHEQALKHDKRPDGRKLDEVRELHAETGIFKRNHGSAIFVRGETQTLAVATLAAPSAEQLVETMETTGKKRFMLHYNFPNFSVGEVGRARGPGRREIGHGALAAKAVQNLIPSKEEFPYTIRVVAETLSSNGSSSMASTCAVSLALMDAGVPIRKHVAGIAIGLMSGDDGSYKVLTDIQGPEDHHGDMDLKIAGTRDGITAIQMDVKIGGITAQIFKEALDAARAARLKIIGVMERELPAPRQHLSPYAPTIKRISINPERIGLLVGPGGRTINGIISATGNTVTIDIDQDGTVYVAGTDAAMVERVLRQVQGITREYKIGDLVEGTVMRLLDFGAIVDLGGERDGMVHISELKGGFVKSVGDVVKVGDRVRAKVIHVEEGKLGLSIKALQE